MVPEEDRDQFRERFVRSFLDWVLLAILQRRPTYGYELISVINEEFGVYVSPGSLYPILYNLEAAGLISGAWEEPDRKSRKVYTLTPEGDRALATGLDTLGRAIESLRKNAGGTRKVT